MKITLELVPVSERLPEEPDDSGIVAYCTDGSWLEDTENHLVKSVKSGKGCYIAWAELPTLSEAQIKQLTKTPEEILWRELQDAGYPPSVHLSMTGAIERYQQRLGRISGGGE